MKINFAELKFRPSLFDAPAPIADINKQLANALWQSDEIEAGRLALRLFDNPEIEISEAEAEHIKGALQGFKQWVKEPILTALEVKEV